MFCVLRCFAVVGCVCVVVRFLFLRICVGGCLMLCVCTFVACGCFSLLSLMCFVGVRFYCLCCE